MSRNKHIAVLDIGTTETRAVIARVDGPGDVEMIACGTCPSMGVARGTVVDLEATTRALRHAVARAEESAGFFPTQVYMGVNGECVESFLCTGEVKVSGTIRGFTHQDVERVIRIAGADQMKPGYEVLVRVPLRFQVDDTKGIEDPVGKSGHRLIAEVYLVTALKSALTDLDRCAKGAGLRVERMVPTGLVTSLGVLSDEEKKAGVALVDIGGGVSSVVIYYDGVVIHAETIPVGGGMITSSVARMLTCSMETAEMLKKTYGAAMAEIITPVETVPVKRIPPRPPKNIPRRALAEIIEERTDRILLEVLKMLHKNDLINRLYAGVILTGGTSLLNGMKDKVEDYLKIETHLGIPSRVKGPENICRSPRFASISGLLEFASREEGRVRPSWLARFLTKCVQVVELIISRFQALVSYGARRRERMGS